MSYVLLILVNYVVNSKHLERPAIVSNENSFTKRCIYKSSTFNI